MPQEIQEKIFADIFPENNFILNCSYKNFLGSTIEIRKILNIQLPGMAFVSKNFYQMSNNKSMCFPHEKIQSIISYFISYINNLDPQYKFTFDQKRKILIIKNLESEFLKQKQCSFSNLFLYSIIKKTEELDFINCFVPEWQRATKNNMFLQTISKEDFYTLVYHAKSRSKNYHSFAKKLSLLVPLCQDKQSFYNIIASFL